MDSSTLISLTSAIVSVSAAGISIWQAQSARRQAAAAHGDIDPTFYLEKGSSDGIPPWRFLLKINNFNRRALDLLEVRIDITGFTVYRDHDARTAVIRSIVDSAKQASGPITFDFRRAIGFTLAGVSPNSAEPSTQSLAFAFGPKTETKIVPDFVPVEVEIEWSYADESQKRTAKLFKTFATSPGT